MADQSMASHTILEPGVPRAEKRFSIWSSVMAEQESKDVVRNGVKVDINKLSKTKKRTFESRDVEDYEFWRKDAAKKGTFVKPGNKKSTRKFKVMKRFKKQQSESRKFEKVNDGSSGSKSDPGNGNSSNGTSSNGTSSNGTSSNGSNPVENSKAGSENTWMKKLSKAQKKRLKRKMAKDKTSVDIAMKLKEPRIDLIQKCIKVIGEEFVMKLLDKVLGIESAGGMMTGNGGRRRTAGGVFFHLVKTDTVISKDQKEKIFGIEQILAAERRKVTKKQRTKFDQLSQVLEGVSFDFLDKDSKEFKNTESQKSGSQNPDIKKSESEKSESKQSDNDDSDNEPELHIDE